MFLQKVTLMRITRLTRAMVKMLPPNEENCWVESSTQHQLSESNEIST